VITDFGLDLDDVAEVVLRARVDGVHLLWLAQVMLVNIR
jgi:hypothetical protein